MPESRLERNPAAVSISSVTLAPYDADTQTAEYLAFTDANSPISIPAGKYNVRIHNEGGVDFTVNGVTLPIGNMREYEARENPSTQRMDLTPAITIVIPAGGSGSYEWEGPSA